MMRKFHAAIVVLLLGCSNPGAAQGEATGALLLVGNKGEDTLSFIDIASGRELGRSPTGKWPHEIAVSPDGRQAAVVSYGAAAVELFDIATRAKVRTIDLSPNAGPHGIVWLSDGRLVITTERSQSVSIADPAAGKLAASIPTAQEGTHMVAVTRDGRRAFTANIPAGTVSVLDLAGNAKVRDLAVGGNPEGIALTNDERTLWVADLEGARVQAFDTATFAKVAEIATGATPIRVAASPDGKWIVTSNLGTGSLTIIDAGTRKKVREVAVSGSEAAGQVTILFGPGGRLYAAETGRDTVAEIDLASGKVLRRLAAGKNGDGLAIVPAR